MDRSNYKLSRLERLPTELIAMILCELDCVGTLMNAIRASPRLWHVYLEFMSLKKYSRIATRVLYNQLDTYDVRHAAISALRYNAIFAGMTDGNEVKHFFANYYNHPSVVKLDCPWMYYDDMASVNKLHGTVSRLADTYLKGIPGIWGGRPGIWTNPTVSEKGRVMRALYYLEMYFNLVREHWILPEMDEGDENALAHGDQQKFAHMDCLLQQFAPWENEQMTSVWEFLVALVVEAYKEVEEHPVAKWCTGLEKYPDDWVKNISISRESPQNIMLLGLRDMEIVISKDHDIKERKFLWLGRPRAPRSREVRSFFFDLTSRSFRHDNTSWPGVYGKQPDALVRTIKDPQHWDSQFMPLYYSEPDDGPFLVWKIMYGELRTRWAAYEMRDTYMLWRRNGYCFWDRARIEAIRNVHVEAGDDSLDAWNIGHLQHYLSQGQIRRFRPKIWTMSHIPLLSAR